MPNLQNVLMFAVIAVTPVLPVQAQEQTGQIAAQSDAAAIRTAITAVYRAISGPVGEPRDWQTFRKLFTQDAQLQAITPTGLRGGSIDDYIALSGEGLVAFGFIEEELTNRIAIYGNLAHVWSSYEGRFTRDGKNESLRGINSFQLYKGVDGIWRVRSLLWQQETPQFPLPDDMAGQ